MATTEDLEITRQYQRVQTTNGTAASAYAATVVTLTKPAASATVGVLTPPYSTYARSPSNLVLQPFGIGSNNNTFKMRVVGWRSNTVGDVTTWTPALLCDVTCTLSSNAGCTGVATGIILNTEYCADTITINVGNQGDNVSVISPADDLSPAHLKVDCEGYELVQVLFHRNSSSATSANALYAWL